MFELSLLPEIVLVLLQPLLAPLLKPVLGASLLTPAFEFVCIAPLLDLFLRLHCFCVCLHLCLHLC